jgi:hypothetical protein
MYRTVWFDLNHNPWPDDSNTNTRWPTKFPTYAVVKQEGALDKIACVTGPYGDDYEQAMKITNALNSRA